MIGLDRMKGVGVLALGGMLSLLIVAVLIKADLGTARSLALLMALVGMFALFCVPIEWLPAIALAAFALVPASLVPTAYVGRAFTPGTLVLAVWAVRVVVSRRPLRVPIPAVLWCIGGFVVWSAATSYLSPLTSTSLAWTMSIALSILLPVLLATPSETQALIRTWLTLGAGLSAYAVVEAVVGRNLVFGFMNGDDVQHWSVYRAYTSFGHPLLAGTFFVATFGLALGLWMTGERRPWLLPTVVLSLVATFATISRGAIVSAVVVVAVVLLLYIFRRGAGLPRILGVVAIVVVAAFAAVRTPRLVERLFSVEVSRSNDARKSGVDVALEGAEHYDWLGAGPGMSQRAVSAFNITQIRIESSYLQLLITVGLPGLVLLLAAVAFAGLAAMRAGMLGPLGALIGVSVSLAFYNAVDARWASHILIGLVLMMCVHRPQPEPAPAPPVQQRARASSGGRA